jgi:hypothetical protein
MHNAVFSEMSEYVNIFMFESNTIIYHTMCSTSLANASDVCRVCKKSMLLCSNNETLLLKFVICCLKNGQCDQFN